MDSVMDCLVIDGTIVCPLPRLNWTYGHCRRWRMEERCFWAGGRSLRFCSNSDFNGRRTGGRSGEMLILSWWFFKFFALSSHWFLCCRSLNRNIMPALALVDRRWHAEKSVTAAFGSCRWLRAKLTQASRVSLSFSSDGPLRPWMWFWSCWLRILGNLTYSPNKL